MTKTKRVVALGFFDGVHRGHAKLIETTKQKAAELNAEAAVLSFDTHPDTLISGEVVPLISSAAERSEMIDRLFGVRRVLIVHFDEETMRMNWREFLDLLYLELSCEYFVIGYDFRFGYRGEGNADKLREYCAERAAGCEIVSQVTYDDMVVSSTYIRELIRKGDIERANEFLGHPHTLLGIVQYGYRLGRKLGAPTINTRIPDGVLAPAYGVYATKVYFCGCEYNAVTNVGVRPTVGAGCRASVESFILNYSGDLYGQSVRIEFFKFLRPERKFLDTEELRIQIKKDAEASRAFFENFKQCGL